jgi:2-polyprenyl-3-methyl-5-hydroxy-6-metoxy-1,4-benzoquinol methylase
MLRYRAQQLVGMGPEELSARLQQLQTTLVSAKEMPDSMVMRRDEDLGSAWGHDHDFGAFKLDGPMGSRHLRTLATFIDRFRALPSDLHGTAVLDVGCWSGGSSLLLAALGADVVAVDEVRRRTQCVDLLKRAFAIDNLEVDCRSLYELAGDAYDDRFDYVLLAGVLYHVTDPVVALRVVFNCLKDGGRCLVETAGHRARKSLLSYEPRRSNWFDPSPAALGQMLRDVGFSSVEVGQVTVDDRLFAVARRERHVQMRRDGLSHPRIR